MCSGWRNPITDHHPLLTARKDSMSSIENFPHAVTPPWWVRWGPACFLVVGLLMVTIVAWFEPRTVPPPQPVGDTQTHVLLTTIATELTMLHTRVHELRLMCGQEGR